MNMVDHERIERAVTEILYAIGEDPERDGLLDTPHVLRACMPKCVAAC
ncbi:MAG: hypothetical protein Ct9H90mP30_2600 [Actinomycetota bacterium]|nr:MAG: hypothetical protein Ct9H90mP30_2600 [Actinomycetota bacterium]